MKRSLLCSLLALSFSVQGETLRMATGYPEATFHTVNARMFAKEVEEKTAGRLIIEVYPAGKLVKLIDIPKAVRIGDVDLGEVLLSAADDIPLAAVDAVPFIARDYDAARRLYTYQKPVLEQTLAEANMSLMYVVPWPPSGLYTKQPITHWRDLRGATMRTYNIWTKHIAERAGATAIDIPNNVLKDRLAEGKITAMITSSASGVTSEAWKAFSVYTPVNAWVPKNAMLANTARISKLSAHHQEVIRIAAQNAEVRGWKMSQETYKESMEVLKKNGMTIGKVSFDLDDELTKFGDRYAQEYVRREGHRVNDIFLPYFTSEINKD